MKVRGDRKASMNQSVRVCFEMSLSCPSENTDAARDSDSKGKSHMRM